MNSQERRNAFLGLIGLRSVNETVRLAMDRSNPGGILDNIFEPATVVNREVEDEEPGNLDE